MGGVLAWVAAGVIGASSVWIAPGSPLDGAVRRGLARERPAVTFVGTSSAATLALRIDTSTTGWAATWTRARGGTDTRALGADVEAAARLAVLLTVERLDTPERAGPAIAETSRDEPGDAPRLGDASTVELRARETTPHTPGPWRIEAGASAVAWTAPISARPALSLAASYRAGRLSAGARAIAAGLCCTLRGDNIDAEATLISALAEGRFAIVDAATTVWATAGVGVAHESLDAEVSGLFAGETAPESTSSTGLVGRGALVVDLPFGAALRPSVSAGVLVHATSLSAKLPAFYASDKSATRRGFFVPFVEVSASWTLP
ncbi:hypothetical protein L6R52_09735 [Myxococcota bacterium]|nr:hypothetical protein [Myxococcota bacterium]